MEEKPDGLGSGDRKIMKRPQEIALRNFCRLGTETARPCFTHVLPPVSIVLSVNAGYE